MIVKPSEIAPHSSAVMKKLIDTYLDSDCYVCLEGGPDVAIAINNLPLDMICFTGSTQVGKIVAQTAAKNLTPCLLELGGKCPVIVDKTADMYFTAARVGMGKISNSGQICIAPDYVFVHEDLVQEFIEQVKQFWKNVASDKPGHSGEFQGKMVNEFHTSRVAKLIESSGGKVVSGG